MNCNIAVLSQVNDIEIKKQTNDITKLFAKFTTLIEDLLFIKGKNITEVYNDCLPLLYKISICIFENEVEDSNIDAKFYSKLESIETHNVDLLDSVLFSLRMTKKLKTKDIKSFLFKDNKIPLTLNSYQIHYSGNEAKLFEYLLKNNYFVFTSIYILYMEENSIEDSVINDLTIASINSTQDLCAFSSLMGLIPKKEKKEKKEVKLNEEEMNEQLFLANLDIEDWERRVYVE